LRTTNINFIVFGLTKLGIEPKLEVSTLTLHHQGSFIRWKWVYISNTWFSILYYCNCCAVLNLGIDQTPVSKKHPI